MAKGKSFFRAKQFDAAGNYLEGDVRSTTSALPSIAYERPHRHYQPSSALRKTDLVNGVSADVNRAKSSGYSVRTVREERPSYCRRSRAAGHGIVHSSATARRAIWTGHRCRTAPRPGSAISPRKTRFFATLRRRQSAFDLEMNGSATRSRAAARLLRRVRLVTFRRWRGIRCRGERRPRRDRACQSRPTGIPVLLDTLTGIDPIAVAIFSDDPAIARPRAGRAHHRSSGARNARHRGPGVHSQRRKNRSVGSADDVSRRRCRASFIWAKGSGLMEDGAGAGAGGVCLGAAEPSG